MTEASGAEDATGATSGGVTAADLDDIGGACAFLSRVLLAAPDAELLGNLAGAELVEAWPFGGQVAAGAVGSLQRDAAAALADPSRADDLVQDHRALFVGPDRLRACPYESVYRSEERLVFEESTLQVREHYARFGVQAPRLNREPDDHIGLECSFLAHVCTTGLDRAEQGDEAGRREAADEIVAFAREHLLVWGDEFVDALRAGAATDFYRAVAELLASLLDRLRELAEPA